MLLYNGTIFVLDIVFCYLIVRLKSERYNFKIEIVEYCRMDVEILCRACIAFWKIFLDIGNTDPFVSATTIASACSYLCRNNFLKANTIGILPPAGYRRADKHSQKAVKWLLQCEREIGREIIHARRAREYRLPEGFLVDGYLPPPTTEATVSTTASPSVFTSDKGDICSLYPYICKRSRFPHGHPDIYVATQSDTLTGANNDNLSRVEGLIKC